MDLRELLNILLLALTLSTVLVTIISFLLFKIRQFSDSKDGDNKTPLVGLFFQRYAPHVVEEIERHYSQKSKSKTKKKRSLGLDLGFLFVLGFLVVAAVMLSENYLAERKIANQRNGTAIEYRKLIDKGLLKSYEFNQGLVLKSLQEDIPSSWKTKLEQRISYLRNQKITIVQGGKGPSAKKSVEMWKNLFKILNIPFKLAKVGSPLKDFVIYPHPGPMDKSNRNWMDQLIEQGAKILVTGVMSSGNNSTTWVKERFNLDIKPNSHSKLIYPSRFKVDAEPFWNLPPGYMDTWNPLDNTFIYHSDSALAWSTLTSGQTLSNVDNDYSLITLKEDKHRIAWSALDPCPSSSKFGAKSFYCKEVILSLLEWLDPIPRANLRQWPRSASIAFALGIDIEEKIDNLKALLKIVNQANIPATLFMASDVLNTSSDKLRGIPSSIEVATQGDEYVALSDQKAEAVFNHIQKSRFDMEEHSTQPILGFRPPYEKYNIETVSAASQNHLSYFFGGQDFRYFSPVFLVGTNMLYIPRPFADDRSLEKNKLLGNENEFLEYLNNKSTKDSRYNGLIAFSVNTKSFGEEFFHGVLSRFLLELKNNNVWFTNFSDLSNWWNARSNTNVEFLVSNNTATLNLKNNSAYALDNLVVQIAWPDRGELSSSGNFEIKKVSHGIFEITIKEILPNSSISASFN